MISPGEQAPRQRTIQHLRQRELCLQNGEVIAIASRPILRGEGMGQPGQPFAQHPLNPRSAEPRGERLQARWIRTGHDAIVGCFIGDALRGQLALEVLVPIETELGVVGKVRAELQEERTKVAVHPVDVVLVDHSC